MPRHAVPPFVHTRLVPVHGFLPCPGTRLPCLGPCLLHGFCMPLPCHAFLPLPFSPMPVTATRSSFTYHLTWCTLPYLQLGYYLTCSLTCFTLCPALYPHCQFTIPTRLLVCCSQVTACLPACWTCASPAHSVPATACPCLLPGTLTCIPSPADLQPHSVVSHPSETCWTPFPPRAPCLQVCPSLPLLWDRTPGSLAFGTNLPCTCIYHALPASCQCLRFI